MGDKLKKTVVGFCAATALIHGVNQVIFRLATRKECLDKNNGKYYKTKFGNMFYKVKGQGDALLLIHDVGCECSGAEWNNVVDKLVKDHKVYVIDLLGCGRSDRPNMMYTTYAYVQILSNFIRDVIGKKVDVMATGSSVSIVMMLHGMSQELIGRLIAISPVYVGESQYEKISFTEKLRNFLIQSPIYGTALYNLFVARNLIEEKFEEEFFANPKNIRRKYVDAYYEAAHLGGANGRYLYSSILNHYMYCNPLKALQKMDRMMVIMGEGMPDCDKTIRQYRKNNASVQCEIIENTRKLPQLERPEEVLAVVRKFLVNSVDQESDYEAV